MCIFILTLSAEDKDRIKTIFRGAWLSPTEFLDDPKLHVGKKGLRIQLKRACQKNRSWTNAEIINDTAGISYKNDGTVKVNVARIAGITTTTDMYRQRKSWRIYKFNGSR